MKAIKNFASSLKMWVLNNKKEAAILGAILLIGATLRLCRIDEYKIFLADQGRDALVVRRLLVNFDPILVGPGTSVGNMYLGPIYYYLMAPALWLANYSPAGPSVIVGPFWDCHNLFSLVLCQKAVRGLGGKCCGSSICCFPDGCFSIQLFLEPQYHAVFRAS